MNIKSLAFTATVLLLCGCTHTNLPNPTNPADKSFAAINKTAKTHTALVRTTAGTTKARHLHLTPDSTSWFDDTSGELEVVTTAQVREIRFTKRAEGAGLGLLRAGGIGIALGAAMGLAAGDDPPCDSFCIFHMSAGQKAAILGASLGLVGAVVGLVGGAANGETYRYVLHVNPHEKAVVATSSDTSQAKVATDPPDRFER